MTLTIRSRQTTDSSELARALERVHAQDGYPVEGVADAEAWLTPPNEIAAWSALYDDHPIGQVTLASATESDDAAIVWHRASNKPLSELVILARLFVDPEHRQHGAGKQLMLTAFNFANQHDLSVAFDVMLKDHAAIRLYEKLGCQRIGVITHHHSNDQAEPAAVYEGPHRGQAS